MNRNFRRWLLQSVLGLLLVQAGLCACIEAGFMKHEGAPLLHWIAAGTAALSVFYAGLSMTVDGIRYRIKWLEEKGKSE